MSCFGDCAGDNFMQKWAMWGLRSAAISFVLVSCVSVGLAQTTGNVGNAVGSGGSNVGVADGGSRMPVISHASFNDRGQYLSKLEATCRLLVSESRNKAVLSVSNQEASGKPLGKFGCDFDGRVAEVLIRNDSGYPVNVYLLHPDSGNKWPSVSSFWKIEGSHSALLKHNKESLTIGSDWKIQLGGAEPRCLGSVAEWDSSQGIFVVSTAQYFKSSDSPAVSNASINYRGQSLSNADPASTFLRSEPMIKPESFINDQVSNGSTLDVNGCDFDGRTGQVRVQNDSLYPVKVYLLHSNTANRWPSELSFWSVPGGHSETLKHDGNSFVVGSSWRIQLGGSQTRCLGSVAEWDSSNEVFIVSTKKFFEN